MSETAVDVPSHSAFPKRHRVTVSDGTEIAYGVLNPGGTKVPLLFANGLSCPDGYWAEIAPPLAERGHPCVMVDTRGHGLSGLPRDPGPRGRNLTLDDVSVERLARDNAEVLADLGTEAAVHIGHSLGCQTVTETWRVAPEKVAGIVTVAGTYENPVPTFANLAVLDTLFEAYDRVYEHLPLGSLSFLRPIAHPHVVWGVMRGIRAAGPDVGVSDVAHHARHLPEMHGAVLLRMIAGMRAHRSEDLLPTITAPVLVCAGSRDYFTPPGVGKRMAAAVPDGEIVFFEHGTHLLPVDDPAGIVAAIDDWLARKVDAAAA